MAELLKWLNFPRPLVLCGQNLPLWLSLKSLASSLVFLAIDSFGDELAHLADLFPSKII
jgi:hypothetical protein